MARLASKNLEESLIEEEIFSRKKKDMEVMKKESGELLLPDFSHTAREVLGDVQYKGIIARAVGKEFGEREFINEKDLQKLMMLSELNLELKKEVEIKLIPIIKKGSKWEDRESRNLRKVYVKKSVQLFDILSKFQFNNITQSEEIFLCGSSVFDKASAYLDFSSAAALVDKGPRKRKTTKASGSVFFREIFVEGERGTMFALFDGFDERGFEYLPSSIAANMFKETANGMGNKDAILQFLESFARKADTKISESVRGFCGASATCGVILGKKMYYISIGNNRIYGIASSGEIHKVVGESLVQIGDLEKLYAELKYPYLYLGGFTQRMKGKRSFRVIHSDFILKPPHIGVADISEFINMFVASSGVWKSTISLNNGKLMAEEGRFREILGKARNALNAVERMNMNVKNSMKEAKNSSLVDDIAMLYFSV